MSFESKSNSLHLETAEEAEKRIEGLTPPTSPAEEAAPSTESVEKAQAIETQRVAEQSEAAELLKRMHETAGASPETVEAAPVAKEEQEKVPSPEQLAQQNKETEMKKLYESLGLSTAGKDQDGFYEQGSRGAVDEEGGSIQSKLAVGLAGEQFNDDKKRENFFKGALITSGAGAAVGIGGATFLGAGVATLGFATGGLALVVGGLGWAGMKAFHAWKERKHEKAFEKIKYGY